jgi:hypothetical protein
VENGQTRSSRERYEFELGFDNGGKGALGAHDELGEIDLVRIQELIEVVPTDSARDTRVPPIDLALVFLSQVECRAINLGL